jgi:hypothetical protein
VLTEWWTYRLSDFLLFSPRTWYRLHELHNAAIWPAQLVALALGISAIVLLLRQRPASRAVTAIFALCWAWVGWIFHLGHYATINWAANWFAAGFALQALLLLVLGVVRGDVSFERAPTQDPLVAARCKILATAQRAAGLALLGFGVLAQPLIGPLLGRPWTQIEAFGVTPDPTVAATLGLLLLASGRAARVLWPLPLAWCGITGATLWSMGSPEAFLMPLVGLAALLIGVCGAASSMRTSGR